MAGSQRRVTGQTRTQAHLAPQSPHTARMSPCLPFTPQEPRASSPGQFPGPRVLRGSPLHSPCPPAPPHPAGPQDHSHPFRGSPPGRGAPWRRALPGRKSRKDAAAVRRGVGGAEHRVSDGRVPAREAGAHRRRPGPGRAGAGCPQASARPCVPSGLQGTAAQGQAHRLAFCLLACCPRPPLLPVHRAWRGFCSGHLSHRIHRCSHL